MKNHLLIILAIFACITVSAQNVKRAYKSLEKSDYIKAKETFEKLLIEDSMNVATNFGMAVVLADEKSTNFNIVDAYEFLGKVKGRENELTQDEIEILGEYFMNTETRKTSRPVKKKIEIAIEAMDDRLIKYIREENNLEAVYAVLDKYPNYKHYDNVIHIRNQFEFRKSEKQNSLEGYQEFLNKFPDAAQAPKAKQYVDKMGFEKVKAQNTVDALNDYIANYPNSDFLQQAKRLRNDLAFNDAETLNTIEGYTQFILNYPDALEIPNIKKNLHKLLYEKAKKIKSLQAYNDFIKIYPDGAFFLDVFNLKAGDLGMHYFKELGFNSTQLKWVRALDNNLQVDKAQAIFAANDGYVVAGTTKERDKKTDVWIVKLDIKGNVVWNKTVGQENTDILENILVTTTGEIIGVGYTQVNDDSASLMGWMFMLGKNGDKLWNKNLGKMKISSSSIAKDNKVYLSVYKDDTIPDNYYIQAYNTQGKKVWERDYVNQGIINDILFDKADNVFLAGSKWFIYTDPKFYLKWEDTLQIAGAEVSLAAFNQQSIGLFAKDTVSGFLMNYSLDGKMLWQKKLALEGTGNKVSKLFGTNQNTTLLFGENDNLGYALLFNSLGEKTAEKQLPNGYKFVDVMQNKSGDIIYLLQAEDFLVISFSSIGF